MPGPSFSDKTHDRSKKWNTHGIHTCPVEDWLREPSDWSRQWEISWDFFISRGWLKKEHGDIKLASVTHVSSSFSGKNWVVSTQLPFVWDVFLCKSEANEIIYNKMVSPICAIWKNTHHLREMLSARLWQSNCQNGFEWNLVPQYLMMHQHLIRNVYNWIQVASLEIWNHDIPCCVITFPNKIAISICKPSYSHIFTIELAIFKNSWTISWVHCCASHFISG